MEKYYIMIDHNLQEISVVRIGGLGYEIMLGKVCAAARADRDEAIKLAIDLATLLYDEVEVDIRD